MELRTARRRARLRALPGDRTWNASLRLAGWQSCFSSAAPAWAAVMSSRRRRMTREPPGHQGPAPGPLPRAQARQAQAVQLAVAARAPEAVAGARPVAAGA